MNPPASHLIFDLDGTVIDSKAEIIMAFRVVFKEVPPAVFPDVDALNYGATLDDILKNVYGDEVGLIGQAKAAFVSLYDASEYLHTSLYDNAVSTLAVLKERGHHLYIATNKRYAPTMRILKKKNILGYFSDVMASEFKAGTTMSKRDMIRELKSRNNFSEGYMIGDTSGDISAGNSENLKTIAVTYGYENSDIFAAQSPTHVVTSFKEIANIV